MLGRLPASLPDPEEPAIAAALRGLLPAGVALSQGSVAAAAASPLFAEEAAAVAQAVPARRAEFAAGRHHARLALQMAGHGAVALAVGPGRAPLWPLGRVGSITHDGHWCAAAVADSRDCLGIGIDIELVARFDASLEPAITTAAERAGWPAGLSGADRRLLLARVFTAKEACFKAHFPATGAWLEFTDAEVTWPAAGGDTFTLRLLRPAGRYPAGHVFSGGSAAAAERVCAAVCLPVGSG